jgi:hypothetical protein
MEQLNRNFLDFIGLLDAKGVDYLVVGGYAVALHGFPRYTGDIDFFVAVDERNASAMVEVFEAFGFGDIGIEAGDFLLPDFVVEIGREPRKIRVLTGIDGVAFGECYSRRVIAEISGKNVGFISREDLIKNKIASGRPKDRIDVSELEKLG